MTNEEFRGAQGDRRKPALSFVSACHMCPIPLVSFTTGGLSQTSALKARTTRALLVLFAVWSLGCGGLTNPEDEGRRVISVLSFDASGEPLIELPDSVSVGEEFPVSIGTMWGDHCASKADTEVEREQLAVRIIPHEFRLTDIACVQVPKTFTHEATVRLNQAGTGRVVVRGRNHAGDVVTYERTVTVQ